MTDTWTIHYCHAKRCRTIIPRHLLMCREHWHMVPGPIRQRVLESYQPGQAQRGAVSPSMAWLDAAKAAIRAVDQTEQAGLTSTR